MEENLTRELGGSFLFGISEGSKEPRAPSHLRPQDGYRTGGMERQRQGVLRRLRLRSGRIHRGDEDHPERVHQRYRCMQREARQLARAMREIAKEKWINDEYIAFLSEQGPEWLIGFARLTEGEQRKAQQAWEETTTKTDKAKESLDRSPVFSTSSTRASPSTRSSSNTIRRIRSIQAGDER